MLACVLLARPDPELARRLFAITPLLERVEDPDSGGQVVFLDVRGTSRLHGGAAGLFAAIRTVFARPGGHSEGIAAAEHAAGGGVSLLRGMALASNRFTAEVAARSSRRAVTIAPGEETLYLSAMPLDRLPLGAELARRLRPLGLQTLGDFASLPVASVDRRYGPEGVALHRLARGEDGRDLLPEQPGVRRSVWRNLEHPVDRLERLEPFIEEALGILCSALEDRGEGALRLRLQLQMELAEEGCTRSEDWGVASAAPETRVPLLLELARLRLRARPPAGPVSRLHLEVLEARSMDTHQGRLFGDSARDPIRRAEALSRLVLSLGSAAVGTPELRAAHRLEDRWRDAEKTRVSESGTRSGRRGHGEVSPRVVRGPALRMLPQAEELLPLSMGGRLLGFRRGRRELSLGRLSLPRRLEGGWWSAPWARDEHDLEPREGGRLRICRDLVSRRWLLLGEFD